MSTVLFSQENIDVTEFVGESGCMYQVTWGNTDEDFMHLTDIIEALNVAHAMLALKSMDVPESRLTLTRWNVGWLQRNLGFRNHQHPQFNFVMLVLNKLWETKCA